MKTVRQSILTHSITSILIPLCIFAAAHLIYISSSLVDSALDAQMRRTATLRDNFDTILQEIERSTDNLASNSLVKSLYGQTQFNATQMREYALQSQLDTVFFSFFGSRPEIEYINLSGEDFQYILHIDHLQNFRMGSYNAYIQESQSQASSPELEGMNQQFIWTDSIENLEGVFREHYIYLIRRIFDDSGSETGRLIIGVNKASIAAALGSRTDTSSSDASAIIFSSDDIQSITRPELVERLDLAGLLTLPERRFSSRMGSLMPYSIMNFDSRLSDWGITSAVSYSSILAGLSPLFLLLSLSLFVCFVSALLGASRLVDSLLQPLNHLSMQVGQFSGELESISHGRPFRQKRGRFQQLFSGSFKQRMNRFFGVVTLIPLILFTLVSYTVFTLSLKDQLLSNRTQEMSQMVNTLDLSYHTFEKTSERIWTNLDFQKALVALNDQLTESERIDQKKILSQILNAELLGQRYLRSISVYDSDGVRIEQVSYKPSENNDQQPALWTDPFGKFSTHRTADPALFLMGCSVSSILQNSSSIGAHIGYIVLALESEYFKLLIQPFASSQGEYTLLYHRQSKSPLYESRPNTAWLEVSAIPMDIERITIQTEGQTQSIWGPTAYDSILVSTYKLNFLEGVSISMVVFSLLTLTILSLGSLIHIHRLTNRITNPLLQLEHEMSQMEGPEDRFNLQAYEQAPSEIRHMAISFQAMTYRIQNLIKEMLEAQEKEKQAELQQKEAQIISLQSQINPHFLYNTLDTVNWKALTRLGRDNEISQIVTSLSKILRESIAHSGSHLIPIDRQLEVIRQYLSIQQIRYGEALSTRWEIDEGIGDYLTIPLLLQPIVENAINHGISKQESGGVITIRGRLLEKTIQLEVEDDGAGLSQEELERINERLKSRHPSEGGKSIGLYNTHMRIVSLFGEEYGIEVRSASPSGTIVTLRFPAVPHEHEQGEK